MRLYLLIVATAAACRYGFDDRVIPADSAVSDPAIDGAPPPPASACGVSASPTPVTITGQTYTFTGFSSTMPIDAVSLELSDRATSALLGTTTSDASGNYSITVTAPGDVILVASRSEFETTIDYQTIPFIAPATFDSPQWNDNAITQIYGTATTRDPAMAMLNVGVFHCDGSSYENVEVAIDPPPQIFGYIAPTGAPDQTQQHTLLPYTFAIGMNQPPGPTTITVGGHSEQIYVVGGAAMRVMMFVE